MRSCGGFVLFMGGLWCCICGGFWFDGLGCGRKGLSYGCYKIMNVFLKKVL